MDAIETSVFCACMAALGLRLAEGILPMQRFAKQIRVLFSALLLISLLRPLVGLDFSAVGAGISSDAALSDMAELGDTARCEAVADCLQSRLQSELDAHHVECEILSVDVHMQDDGCIGIDEVLIGGNTLMGTVYLREWLGNGVTIAVREEAEP